MVNGQSSKKSSLRKKPILWTREELMDLFLFSLPEDFAATGVSIDTRTLKPGDIFIAIEGEAHDGHRFVKVAEEKGASLVIVSASKLVEMGTCPVLQVENTLDAMRTLGRAARLRSKAQIIAITGSVGKTSSKEILRHALSPFGKVAWSEASYNNHWGVPLTLSRLPRDADFAILEIGMNRPGEIAPLSEMVRPNIVIITSIMPAHIGNMRTIEAIAEEKSQILAGLEPEGIVIVPSMPEHYQLFRAKAMKKFPRSFISFGQEGTADVQLLGFTQENGEAGLARIAIGEQRFTLEIPLQGVHMAMNSLISMAVARALRLNYKKMITAIKMVSPIRKRCQVHHLIIDEKSIVLIDDSYNANLASMIAGLDTLISITPQGTGRRIAVLGEMLELGGYAINHHQQISNYCSEKAIDKVFLCGGEALKQGFSGLSSSKKEACVDSYEELIPLVRAKLQDQDVILVKGSKGSKVSQIAENLLAMTKN